MESESIQILVTVPVALVIVNQVLKTYFGLATKWVLIVSFSVGIGLTIGMEWGTAPLLFLALKGFITGAAAGGVYDGVKYSLTGR